ncbi:helix-turn-helix domain-containing protein, partial [candidate division KSB1 bacterium]
MHSGSQNAFTGGIELSDRTKKRVLNLEEAAEYVGVCRSTIESWISSGVLPYEELPGTGKGKYRFRRIRIVDLDELLEMNYHSKQAEENAEVKNPIVLSCE